MQRIDDDDDYICLQRAERESCHCRSIWKIDTQDSPGGYNLDKLYSFFFHGLESIDMFIDWDKNDKDFMMRKMVL